MSVTSRIHFLRRDQEVQQLLQHLVLPVNRIRKYILKVEARHSTAKLRF